MLLWTGIKCLFLHIPLRFAAVSQYAQLEGPYFTKFVFYSVLNHILKNSVHGLYGELTLIARRPGHHKVNSGYGLRGIYPGLSTSATSPSIATRQQQQPVQLEGETEQRSLPVFRWSLLVCTFYQCEQQQLLFDSQQLNELITTIKDNRLMAFNTAIRSVIIAFPF